MAGRLRHWVERGGRYWARLVVPTDLVPYVGKTELRLPLGGDKRTAQRAHAAAVARLQARILEAERERALATGQPVEQGRQRRLTPEALAWAHYNLQLSYDSAARNHPILSKAVGIGVDDGEVARLRAGIAGALSNDELEALVGNALERFGAAGQLDVAKGSSEWRAAARALCVAQLEFLGRLLERDQGNFDGTPLHPLLASEPEPEEEELPPVSLRELFRDYVAARGAVGRGRSTEGRWRPVIESLREHLGHDDARRITRADLIAWRDKLLATLSAKTVSDVHLAAVRAILRWAHENERLPANVAATVRQPKPKAVRSRERGYTDDEAVALLKAARAYRPKEGQSASTTEGEHLTRAKRWVPWLCAFTGSRVTEMTQLRRQDFRREGEGWVVRISPDAGSTKSGNFRDVPLHPQLIELGLVDMLDEAGPGPLFWRDGPGRDPLAAARTVSGRLSEWVRTLKVAPQGVAPNHAWRHRFKTVAIEAGLAQRVVDAIQDHAPRTAGEGYGDVTLTTKRKAIDRMPHYSVD